MNAQNRYTFSQVVQSYAGSKRREEIFGEWGSVVTFRPLSFLVTPFFLNAGIGATTVTVLSLLVVCLLPLLTWSGGYVALGVGAILVAVLDCVDGNMARTTGQFRPIGQYTDFLTDVVFRLVLYACIGYAMANEVGTSIWAAQNAIAIGLVSAIFPVLARLTRLYVERTFGTTRFYEDGETGETKGKSSLQTYLFSFLSGLDPLTPIAVLVLGYFGWLHWLMMWLFALGLADFLYTQFRAVRRLR